MDNTIEIVYLVHQKNEYLSILNDLSSKGTKINEEEKDYTNWIIKEIKRIDNRLDGLLYEPNHLSDAVKLDMRKYKMK